MIFSRHIYWVILLHVMLILVTSGTGVWLIISQRGFVIGTLLITCSLFQISRLVNKLNSFNQKLRVFFDAIEDKDNMLYFPEQNVSKEQEKLNRSLNRINFLLAKTQSEYSKQEHFYRSLLEEVPSGVLAWDSTGKIIIANSTALSLLDCQQLTRYRQLESLLQEKGKKEHLSLSQSRMKLQDKTITLLSIKDIGDELSDKESESWNKLSHVLTHEIMNTIAPIISLSQTLSTYPDINEKVLLNLLKNSMQALEGKEKGRISIHALQDEHISIDIADNGPGIPPELQEKIFIPFFTTKSEGSGIGLSLCKQIIRLHDGHLTIQESNPGKTIFHIDMPL